MPRAAVPKPASPPSCADAAQAPWWPLERPRQCPAWFASSRPKRSCIHPRASCTTHQASTRQQSRGALVKLRAAKMPRRDAVRSSRPCSRALKSRASRISTTSRWTSARIRALPAETASASQTSSTPFVSSRCSRTTPLTTRHSRFGKATMQGDNTTARSPTCCSSPANARPLPAARICGGDAHCANGVGRPRPASTTLVFLPALRSIVPLPRAVGDATGPLGGLALEREELRPIKAGSAGRHLKFRHHKGRFRDSVVYNRRKSRSPYVDTSEPEEAGSPRRGQAGTILVHQDGGSRGRANPAPARGAMHTIVGTESTVATPTVLAARQEMRSWRMLALEPSAMRQPDRYTQQPGIATRTDAHLPATLHHSARTASNYGDDAVPTSSAWSPAVCPTCCPSKGWHLERRCASVALFDGRGRCWRAAASEGNLPTVRCAFWRWRCWRKSPTNAQCSAWKSRKTASIPMGCRRCTSSSKTSRWMSKRRVGRRGEDAAFTLEWTIRCGK